jgi:formyltetrahydrofolate deformylase
MSRSQWCHGLLHSNELSCCVTTVCGSNHEHGQDSFLRKSTRTINIPFHYVPAQSNDRREDEIRDLVEQTDLLILARYMQILSPNLLSFYNNDIINIHHGLLPSFKRANPYKQEYDSGVKIIGATAHFVTPIPDEGPIIEQRSERVSHILAEIHCHHSSQEFERWRNSVCSKLSRTTFDHKTMRYSQDRCAVMN